MPSFENIFGRQQSQKHLQYDNAAFLHFSISLSLVAILLISTLLIRELFLDKRSKRLRQMKDNVLFSRQVVVQKEIQSSKWRSTSIMWKLFAIIILATATCLAFANVSDKKNQIKGFDPYELLGVDSSTPIEKIRKAYRKLALELHPDRNPNNFEAASKFIMVSKAYQCLTDEKIKEICMKYGNPDGQQSFKVGIALPSILIHPDNHIFVMCWTFIVFIIIIPKLFLNWNVKLQAKDERGVLVDNYENMFYALSQPLDQQLVDIMISRMNEVTDPKLSIVPAGSLKRKKNIQKKSKQEGEQEQVDEEVEEQIAITQSMIINLNILKKYRQQKFLKANLIMMMPHLLREIIVFGLDFGIQCQKKRVYLSSNLNKLVVSFMGIGQLQRMIRYSQEFYQNSPRTKHSLSQISLTQEQQALFGQKITINNLVKQQQARNALISSITDPIRKQLLCKEIKSLPNLHLDTVTMAGKETEHTFTNNDIVTFKFTVTREFSNQNPYGTAYLKEYPYLKQEKYYLIVEYNDTLLFFEEVSLQPGKPYEASYNYVHRGPPIVMDFKVSLNSDCYYGLDQEQMVPVKFIPFKKKLKIQFHHTDRNLERIRMNALEQVFFLDLNGAAEDQMLSDTQEKAQEPKLKEQQGKMREEGHHQHGHCCQHHHHHEENQPQTKKQQKQQASKEAEHEMHPQQHEAGCGCDHEQDEDGSEQSQDENAEDDD